MASELGAVLGRRLTRHVGRSIRVDLANLDRLLRAGPARQGLPDIIVALAGEPLLQKQLRLDARTAANRRIKHELLELMARVPELAPERALLQSTPDGPISRPPVGTVAGTTSWQVYELAMRAACIWWSHRGGRRLAAKQLAGQAFGDTKGWTDQRRLAFANLVHRPFDQAVDEADIPIRLSGPLAWVIDGTVADAAAARPWIAVPAHGVRTLGYVDCAAHGILLVENTEAFEKVCLLGGVTDRWLCVWNQGNPSKRLMRFLADLKLPMAAWLDLDAYGIRMIANLEKEIGWEITPVGMSVDLWSIGTKRNQDERQLAMARKIAAELSMSGPLALRELAAAIARTGDCCEQETLYEHVLPTLPAMLRELERK
ncbi:Wadjet anti-phage system protein JetD domain-containing protein [Micromonospora matsumotoense]|uniref:Wadjet anti-phage system protein JetD domain-containing protein n=1 Tax=Micromonospora matsumotoense TaxID=121616 RepID=UPI0034294C18